MFRHWCLLMLLGALVGCGAAPAPGTTVVGTSGTNEPRILDGHTKDIERLVFSPDGQTLASVAAADAGVKLWDVATGKLLHTLPEPSLSVVFTADSKTLANGGKEIKLWDVATGKASRKIDHPAFYLAITQDGKKLASAIYGGKPNERKTQWEMTIWELPAFKETKRFHGEGTIEDLVFTTHGKNILVQSQDDGTLQRRVVQYETATGKEVKYLAGDVWCLALSADGKDLAIGDREGQISLRDLHNTGRRRAKIKAAELPSPEVAPEAFPLQFYGLAYSPDGKLVAAAIRDAVKVFEVESGKLLAELKSEAYATGPVAFSPDGKILASGRREILFWDMTAYTAPVNGQTK